MSERPAATPQDAVSAGAAHHPRAPHAQSPLLILGVAIGVTTLLAIVTIVTGLSGRIRDDVVSSSRPYLYVGALQRPRRRGHRGEAAAAADHARD